MRDYRNDSNIIAHSLEKGGILDSTKAYLISKITTSLKSKSLFNNNNKNIFTTSLDKKYSAITNPLLKLSLSLVNDFLKKTKLLYTLTTFQSESKNLFNSSYPYSEGELMSILNIGLNSLEEYQEETNGTFIGYVLKDKTKLLKRESEIQTDISLSNNTIISQQQNDSQRENNFISIDDKLKNIDKKYDSKLSYEKLFPNKILEDRFDRYKRETELKCQENYDNKLKRFKEVELAQMRVEENKKYTNNLEHLRDEYEKEFQSKLTRLKQNENESKKRYESKEKELNALIIEHKEKFNEEMQNLKKKEDIMNEKVKNETSKLKILQDNLEFKLKEAEDLKQNSLKRIDDEVQRYKINYEKKFLKEKEEFEDEKRMLKVNKETKIDLTQKLNEIEKEKKDLLMKIEQLKNELTLIKISKNNIDTDNDSLRKQIVSLTGKVKVLEENENKYINEKNKLNEENRQLRESLSQRNSFRDNQYSNINDVNANNNNITSSIGSTNRNNNNNNIKGLISEMDNKRYIALEGEIMELKNKYNQLLNDKYEMMNNNIDMQRDMYNDMHNMNRDISNEIQMNNQLNRNNYVNYNDNVNIRQNNIMPKNPIQHNKTHALEKRPFTPKIIQNEFQGYQNRRNILEQLEEEQKRLNSEITKEFSNITKVDKPLSLVTKDDILPYKKNDYYTQVIVKEENEKYINEINKDKEKYGHLYKDNNPKAVKDNEKIIIIPQTFHPFAKPETENEEQINRIDTLGNLIDNNKSLNIEPHSQIVQKSIIDKKENKNENHIANIPFTSSYLLGGENPSRKNSEMEISVDNIFSNNSKERNIQSEKFEKDQNKQEETKKNNKISQIKGAIPEEVDESRSLSNPSISKKEKKESQSGEEKSNSNKSNVNKFQNIDYNELKEDNGNDFIEEIEDKMNIEGIGGKNGSIGQSRPKNANNISISSIQNKSNHSISNIFLDKFIASKQSNIEENIEEEISGDNKSIKNENLGNNRINELNSSNRGREVQESEIREEIIPSEDSDEYYPYN